MMGDTAASITGPSCATARPQGSSAMLAMLYVEESERMRVGMLLTVPSAE